MDITSFFLLVSFGEFWQKNYLGMWGHYGSRIMGNFLGPLNKVLGTTSISFGGIVFILWKIVPHLFFRELGSSGYVFVL
jgi:hypothetical protein